MLRRTSSLSPIAATPRAASTAARAAAEGDPRSSTRKKALAPSPACLLTTPVPASTWSSMAVITRRTSSK